ncbi:uncharacterized protein LOC111710299 [Eurytemora carolleeae]|uniref:uncharacterized protein LOC111710299 n=1 Tax=Eurytemora carolleeae TaxID=1294199 RepID=UPI000C765166|nr:uncharacterized protein LOC111710299 [Eurytemora carolleeae]|eukprot:XP_023340120.1 uncharacterized protein LOC111710299 [Eurytemora affinis]
MRKLDISQYIPVISLVSGYTRVKLKDDIVSSLCSVVLTAPLCLALSLTLGCRPDILLLSTGIYSLLLCLMSPSISMTACPSLPLLLLYTSSPSSLPSASLSLLISSGLLILLAVLKIGDVSRYVSPTVLTGLGCSSMFLISSYSSIGMLGMQPSQPPGNVLSAVQYMYTNHLNIQACDAALGFSALGILIAIKALPGVYIGEGPDLTTIKSRLVRNIKLILSISRFFILLLISILLSSALSNTFTTFPSFPPPPPFQCPWSVEGVGGVLLKSVLLAVLAVSIDQENFSDLEPGDSNLSSRIQAISNLVSSCLGSPPVSSIPAPVHASTPLVHLFSGIILITAGQTVPLLIQFIPTSVLFSSLISFSILLPNINTLVTLGRFDRPLFLVCSGTVVVSLLVHTLAGVLVGVGLDLVLLVHRFTRTRIQDQQLSMGEQTLRVLTPAGDLYSHHVPELRRVILQPYSHPAHPAHPAHSSDEDNYQKSRKWRTQDHQILDVEEMHMSLEPEISRTCLNLEKVYYMDPQVARFIRICQNYYRREGSSLVIAGASKAIEQLLNDILPTQICTFIDNIQPINTSDTASDIVANTASDIVADTASHTVPADKASDIASDKVSDTDSDIVADTSSHTVPADRTSETVADTASVIASDTASNIASADKATETISDSVADTAYDAASENVSADKASDTVADTAYEAGYGKYNLKISSSVMQGDRGNLSSENSPFSDLELENYLSKSLRVISKPANSKSLENEVIALEVSPKDNSSQSVEYICESTDLESAELKLQKFSELK